MKSQYTYSWNCQLLAGVAIVLVALALSMFGLYDIRVPTGLMQKAGARAGGAGAYAMGLLVGIVAAPCIGPVVLALLTFVASRQDAAFGFLIFFVLSLGLGLPYLFLAVFSGSLARLPRRRASICLSERAPFSRACDPDSKQSPGRPDYQGRFVRSGGFGVRPFRTHNPFNYGKL